MTQADATLSLTDDFRPVTLVPDEPPPGVVVDSAPGAPALLEGIVVCSFYTDDDYYRTHARTLRANLHRLGVPLVVEEVHKRPGEDWADICRRKIGFLARVCEQNPNRKVFWIDVDCSVLSLPHYVQDFTADIIGFQRGFGSPLTLGYGNRTRFWEPCFFGINTTGAARKFIRDASIFERDATVKATDDYFFEESWRANAASMTFQLIPSAAVLAKASAETGVVPFFAFGSSGNVTDFKGKVAQHASVAGAPRSTVLAKSRRTALAAAKRLERALPGRASRSLRRVADQVGITHVLTGGGAGGAPASGPTGASPHRARLARHMIGAAQRGEVDTVAELYARLESTGVPAPAEVAAKRAADSFAHYRTVHTDSPAQLDPLPLMWWARPFPGNFGDWLSPLLLTEYAARPVSYQPPTAPSLHSHLVGVGSIGRFIKPGSVVVGTGISTDDLELETKATYLSVRGPVTAQVLRRSGGPDVESFGDPGALIRRVVPLERGQTNGRTVLVRHSKHANVPLQLPETMDELSVLVSHPEAIASFLAELNQYDAVVTSAMHVMIVCHSYGIPCALIGFEGLESVVHGTGVKYGDYSRGVGLATVSEPQVVGLDLRRAPLPALLTQERISDAKLDEIEQALRGGVAAYLDGVG